MSKYLKALEVINTLEDNDFEGYIVGGFVRDKLLNVYNDDIDITTSAKLEEIEKLFNIINKEGQNYLSVRINYKEELFELTTFRKDIEYIDYRHPIVEYTNLLSDDILRRDFTINSLLIDKNGKIIDKSGGLKDLNKKVISTIGDPNIKIKEDPIRILRGLYLVSKHNFKFKEDLRNAVLNNVHLLDFVSYERKIFELNKIIGGSYKNISLKLMIELNIIEYFPRLKEGIKHIIKTNQDIDSLDLFYLTCFYFNEYTLEDKLSKEKKSLYNEVYKVYNYINSNTFNNFHLFKYKINVCSLAFKLFKVINEKELLTEKDITNKYNSLNIKDKNELNISFKDIVKILNNDKDLSLIKNIYDTILNMVLNNNLENNYDSIKEYIIRNYS